MNREKNKEIQKKRIMYYFVESAKEIIRKKGMDHISIRKIADKAGYSHATLYSYFDNIDELLCYCVYDFLLDCHNHTKSQDHPEEPVEKVISIITSLVEYYMLNPHIFNLVFIYNLDINPKKEIAVKLGESTTTIAIEQSLSYLVDRQLISHDNAHTLKNIIIQLIIGKLILYVKNQDQINKEKFMASLKKELTFLFQ